MTDLFTRHSKEEHADALASYLPDDDNFAAKGIDGTKLRQLVLGLGKTFRNAEDFLAAVWTELDPSTTNAFIVDWEDAVGIPDD